LKLAAALVLTAPFVPMLFQGEEWGASTPFQYFTDHADRELGQAVTRGRRREFAAFGWDPASVPDPQAAETFQRSKLNWAERTQEPHASLLDWHRKLIRGRRGLSALHDGALDRVRVRYDEQARWLVMERGPVSVACNVGAAPRTVSLTDGRRFPILLASATDVALTATGIHLPPDAVAILGPAGMGQGNHGS
jgi:maltooligosyltrehalose trehalohydrolase